MEIQIENLKAQISGTHKLNIHQHADALIEFNKLLSYVVELESRVENLTIPSVIKSLPNDKEVKKYIDTLPYYGYCTTEYNEGFEDGVKWVKNLQDQQLEHGTRNDK